ncbi:MULTISPECIES: tetratricopeptide repeat protein [Novosphingobium]|nr:hypothetical protein [Novosphingobium resinovorum]
MSTNITHTIITAMARMKNGKISRKVGAGILAVGWYLAIAAVAMTAIGVQLDRQTRRDAALARVVPAPFQGYALEVLAREAFERNDYFGAAGFSRELLERRPIPAENLSLYGMALLNSGQVSAAEPALQLAAQRGWRDRFVQRLVILSALQNEDSKIAAQRVLGLWRQGDQSSWVRDLTQAVLMRPAGLAAFNDALVLHEGDWVPSFLVWSARNLPASTVKKLSQNLSSRYSLFNCHVLSDETDRLVLHGKAAEASALWQALCSNESSQNPDVLAFGALDREPGPLSWRYPDSAGISLDVAKEEDGAVLLYENSDAIRHLIARRYLQLAPAKYTLDTRMSARGAEWYIACTGAKSGWYLIKLLQRSKGQMEFTVPTANCQIQELRVVVRMGTGKIMTPVIRMFR